MSKGFGFPGCVERQNECLKRISAKQVLAACRELLNRESQEAETLKSGEPVLKSTC
jgi:hypothetical protein